MNRVAIVDYGMCNLDSVARAVQECGGVPVVTDRAEDLRAANRIILPGVGAFPDAMRNLKLRSLDCILHEEAIEKQIPLLAICLGMQLLATRGGEFEETDGLGWVPGEVKRLEPFGDDIHIPHIGWNEVRLVQESPLFTGIPSGTDYYFVHSYHLGPLYSEDALAVTPYGRGFTSAVQRGLVFGVQFHPEKSQRWGLRLLKNFLAI